MVSRRAASGLLVIALAALVAAPARAATPYLYVSNSASGQIAQYTAFGSLSPIAPGTVSAAGAGPLVVPAAATSLYAGRVAGGINSSIYQYGVGGDGALTPRSPATVAVGGENTGGELAMTPDGTSLYFAIRSGAVYQYTVAGDGTLLPKAPASVAVPAASAIVVSPDGKSAYVARDGATSLYQFTVGTDGALAPKSPPTVTVDMAFAPRLAVAPGGDVYMTGGGKIQQFSAAANGTLSAKSPASVPVGAGANDIVASLQGTRVYVSVPSIPAGSIAVFARATDGQLTPAPTPSAPTAKLPVALTLTSDGGFLYVAESGNYSDQQAIVERFVASGEFTQNGSTNVFALSAGAPSDVIVTAESGAVPTPPGGIPTVTATPTPTPTATPAVTPALTSLPIVTPTATPYPVAARLGPLPKRAKVKRNRARIKVTCLAGAACTGRLVLKRKSKRAGRAGFSIAAGSSKVVKVKLSKAARKARRKARRHRIKVKATATAGSSTVKRTISLR